MLVPAGTTDVNFFESGLGFNASERNFIHPTGSQTLFSVIEGESGAISAFRAMNSRNSSGTSRSA
jgi:hypothetical protein